MAARPRYHFLYGFSNTLATIPGIVGVTVTGWMIDLTGTYTAAFTLAAAIVLVVRCSSPGYSKLEISRLRPVSRLIDQ